MVRIFLEDAGANDTILFKEVWVPATTKSGKASSFEYTIAFEDDFELQSNYTLYVSTEKAESFKIFAVTLSRAYAA